MDPSQDNPVVRFKAFFWALGVFALFGVALAIVALVKSKEPQTLEDVVAGARYENRAKVDATQDSNFSYKEVEAGKLVQVKPADVFAHVGKQLVATKAAAVEKPEQVLPGTEAAKQIAEKAASAAPVVIQENDASAPIDPKVMEAGKAEYALCSACHGAEGQGVPNLAPPLAESEWVVGPVENPIRITLRGLGGPITVKGVEYKLAAPMMAVAHLSDEQIANVLTYVRNSFGNKASAVSADQVKAFRGEVGLPALEAKDLKAPK
jgi:mono/diheme cytochrome c family protein